MLASYNSTLIMPPKKGRYITAAACARAEKATLHRVQTLSPLHQLPVKRMVMMTWILQTITTS
jgi:hypothetical protein